LAIGGDVETEVWKIEGLDHGADRVKIAETARKR